MTLSGVEVDTGNAAVVPLATARRVADSGVNLSDGRGGVDFDFLLAGCTATSCQQVQSTLIHFLHGLLIIVTLFDFLYCHYSWYTCKSHQRME